MNITSHARNGYSQNTKKDLNLSLQPTKNVMQSNVTAEKYSRVVMKAKFGINF